MKTLGCLLLPFIILSFITVNVGHVVADITVQCRACLLGSPWLVVAKFC